MNLLLYTIQIQVCVCVCVYVCVRACVFVSGFARGGPVNVYGINIIIMILACVHHDNAGKHIILWISILLMRAFGPTKYIQKKYNNYILPTVITSGTLMIPPEK